MFFALDTLNHPYVVGSTLPREEIAAALQQRACTPRSWRATRPGKP